MNLDDNLQSLYFRALFRMENNSTQDKPCRWMNLKNLYAALYHALV